MGGRNEVPGEVRGHHHYSVLGRQTLPVDANHPEGPAILVFRQESVVITDPDTTGTDAVGTRGRGAPGRGAPPASPSTSAPPAARRALLRSSFMPRRHPDST